MLRLSPPQSGSVEGDYTAERDEVFAGLTVDQIADAIRKDTPAPPPAG